MAVKEKLSYREFAEHYCAPKGLTPEIEKRIKRLENPRKNDLTDPAPLSEIMDDYRAYCAKVVQDVERFLDAVEAQAPRKHHKALRKERTWAVMSLKLAELAGTSRILSHAPGAP